MSFGPTPVGSPTGGKWIVVEPPRTPYGPTPVGSPTGGKWIVVEPPRTPYGPTPVGSPTGGKWIIAGVEMVRSGFHLGSLRFGSRPGF